MKAKKIPLVVASLSSLASPALAENPIRHKFSQLSPEEVNAIIVEAKSEASRVTVIASSQTANPIADVECW